MMVTQSTQCSLAPMSSIYLSSQEHSTMMLIMVFCSYELPINVFKQFVLILRFNETIRLSHISEATDPPTSFAEVLPGDTLKFALSVYLTVLSCTVRDFLSSVMKSF